jgi:hypothetical protein
VNATTPADKLLSWKALIRRVAENGVHPSRVAELRATLAHAAHSQAPGTWLRRLLYGLAESVDADMSETTLKNWMAAEAELEALAVYVRRHGLPAPLVN